MSWTTIITVPNTNTYLYDLVVAARLAASQVPIPEGSAIRIIYTADKDNTGRIFRVTEHTSAAEGQPLLAEESWDDEGSAGASHSLREWFVRSENGTDKLEIEMVN